MAESAAERELLNLLASGQLLSFYGDMSEIIISAEEPIEVSGLTSQMTIEVVDVNVNNFGTTAPNYIATTITGRHRDRRGDTRSIRYTYSWHARVNFYQARMMWFPIIFRNRSSRAYGVAVYQQQARHQFNNPTNIGITQPGISYNVGYNDAQRIFRDVVQIHLDAFRVDPIRDIFGFIGGVAKGIVDWGYSVLSPLLRDEFLVKLEEPPNVSEVVTDQLVIYALDEDGMRMEEFGRHDHVGDYGVGEGVALEQTPVSDLEIERVVTYTNGIVKSIAGPMWNNTKKIWIETPRMLNPPDMSRFITNTPAGVFDDISRSAWPLNEGRCL